MLPLWGNRLNVGPEVPVFAHMGEERSKSQRHSREGEARDRPDVVPRKRKKERWEGG